MKRIIIVALAIMSGGAGSAFMISSSHSLPFRFRRQATSSHSLIHTVDGIECREVPIEIETLGTITVLEATAKSQDVLINAALLEEDEALLNAGDPYGAVLWPAASAVAEYLLQEQEDTLSTASILELGTGTGLVSLALSRRGGARRIMATDYESVPLKLLKYADIHLNKDYGQSTPIETSLFDLCDVKTPLPQDVDLVVVADIMYEPKTGRCMAHRAVEALRNGCRVVIGDSPGRAGRPAFLETLHEMGVVNANFFETTGRTCLGPRHELICGKGSTSVSLDDKPQELQVALLDLRPKTAFGKS